jgi:predicted nucleotidyltransferase
MEELKERRKRTDPRRRQESKGPSGRFVLRIDPGLHAALRGAAEAAGMSLNAFCALKLSATPANLGSISAGRAIERAAALFGEELVGVVLFGSWARGEMVRTSDVDLLVVVDDTVAINRELYRSWDAEPIIWGGRRVEPQFVHFGGSTRRPAGLWAEIAIDGIVIFDRGFELSHRLVDLRRDIAEGRLIRRVVSGQAYWVEAA